MVGMITLTILDTLNVESRKAFIIIGDIIIIFNFCVQLVPIVFIVAKGWQLLKIVSVFFKGEPTRVLFVSASVMLFLPLQQAGFGFEEVQIAGFKEFSIKLSSPNTNDDRCVESNKNPSHINHEISITLV